MNTQLIVKSYCSRNNAIRALFAIFVVLCAVAFSNASYAKVTQLSISVDRNTILLDESVQLTVTAQGSADRDAISFRALQTNFRVSQPSFSQSTQIINGAMSRNITWTVNLYPKAIGSFRVPSFTIDGESSLEFTLNVLPVDSTNAGQPREFFVSANIDTQSVYLQQQILYTVKIHLARDIQRGQLTQPDLVGAIIEQIGEDEDYQEIIDGVRYRIIERKYAIIPQASGNYVIAGPIFEAEVPTNSRRSFANFGRSETVSRRAPDINVTVQPIPDDYSQTWLPSEMVEISEQWQGETEPFTVGEPVTRTITLTALGLTKEQLPEISLPYHPSFKVYPEQPNLASVERNDKLIAQGVFNSAIIPEEAGSFILPEVRIPWFNVNTGMTEFAILPPRSIEVIAKSSGSPAAQQNNFINEGEQSVNTTLPTRLPVVTAPTNALNWLHYLLITTNILLLCAVYLLYTARSKRSHNDAPSMSVTATHTFDESEAFARVQGILKQQSTQGLTPALEIWLQNLFKQPFYSISASLAMYPESRALESYNKTLANSFSSQKQTIDYEAFSAQLSHFRSLAKTRDDENARSILYAK